MDMDYLPIPVNCSAELAAFIREEVKEKERCLLRMHRLIHAEKPTFNFIRQKDRP